MTNWAWARVHPIALFVNLDYSLLTSFACPVMVWVRDESQHGDKDGQTNPPKESKPGQACQNKTQIDVMYVLYVLYVLDVLLVLYVLIMQLQRGIS